VRMTRRDSFGEEVAVATDSESGSAPIRTIVVPLDGSAFGEQALPYARALAKGLGVPILLVTAVHLDTFIAADTRTAGVSPEILQTIMDDETAQARDYLARVQRQLAEDGLTVETKADFGYATGFILEAVKSQPGALVVMSSHGRSGIIRSALG